MIIVVKNDTNIEKYGFARWNETGTEFVWARIKKSRFVEVRGGINMFYHKSTKRITLQSASSDCIAVLCEMYKNGDIEFVADKDFVNMKLTKEEADLIAKRREKQNGNLRAKNNRAKISQRNG